MTEKQKDRNREWLKDLRSGKFEQIAGQLASDQEFAACCCLGVACETRARLLGIQNVNRHDNSVPSGSVVKFFGWGSDDPPLAGTNEEYAFEEEITEPASAWNDDYRATFPQIADMIESNFGLTQE